MKQKTAGWKRCPYCSNYYQPYIRTANTQKSCRRISCLKKHKKKLQKKWEKNNPDCFCGRYVKTKAWLKNHPGYLAGYRVGHPEYIRKDNSGRRLRKRILKERRADIQVRLLRRKIVRIKELKGADIQGTLNLKLDATLDIMAGCGGPIYKSHGQLKY